MSMRKPRPAFTLTELLVVMALMAVMATFAIAFFPNAASSQREARAAQNVQGWLNIAKQRALRDQAPRGLRLWIKTPPWSSVITYKTGDTVSSGGLVYMSSQNNNLNRVVTNTLFWNAVPISDEMLPMMVTECQYIEQPDDFVVPRTGIGFPAWSSATNYTTGSPVIDTINGAPYCSIAAPPNLNRQPSANPNYWQPYGTMTSNAGGTQLNFAVVPDTNALAQGELLNGRVPLNAAEQKFWAVQPGDYVEVLGTGMMHRIGAMTATTLTISPALPYPITVPTTNYRILRAPRAVGDEMLKLPNNTLIDLSTNYNATNPNPLPQPVLLNEGTGFIDILFAPNGSVISRGVTTTNIHLWVRSPNQETPTDAFRGDPTIVSVFVRTGFVGAFAPSPAGDPYALVR